MQQLDANELVNASPQEWRRALHRFPEIGFDVSDTAEFVAQLLESFGIEVHKQIGQSGIVGVLTRGKSTRSIGLRADMDALSVTELNTFEHKSQHPGKMHACGHDGHMAMLMDAARHLSLESTFEGTVYFIFQPNEEHGLGAKAMMADGLFKRFPMQGVYGMHNMPGMALGDLAMNSGAVMAGEDNFLIEIKGRGGHASQPHHHIDPIPISAEIVLALQTIVSRNIDPCERAVVSITEIITDGTVNVIPSNIRISGDCRNFNDQVSQTIESSMERIVKGICEANGAEHKFEYQRTFPATINTEKETGHAINAAIATVGEARTNQACEAFTISEDFANMLKVKDGCYIFIGNGMDSEGGCMLHNPLYDFNDEIIETGSQYWVNLVEQQLPRGAAG